MKRALSLLGHLRRSAAPNPPPTVTRLLLIRRLSSSTSSSDPSAAPPTPPVDDVNNKEFTKLTTDYLDKDDESLLPEVAEAVLRRQFNERHNKSDAKLLQGLRNKPLPDSTSQEIESDFEQMHETDEELDNLYESREYIKKLYLKDPYFNMTHEKWEEMIREAMAHGYLKDTRELEDMLDDMVNYNKYLPDEIKQKIEDRFAELGEMCERGELEPKQAYEQYKEFEDQMVEECLKIEAEKAEEEEDELPGKDMKPKLDDPPGEGPILRWQSRIVFGPGDSAWHPKNRLVKLSVTVKELELSRHALRRLRELVGKRYDSGRDELTITSERFEHREENRKDCLRTLIALVKEAKRADELVAVARNAYVKERLKANPAFMSRLKAKVAKMRESQLVSA